MIVNVGVQYQASIRRPRGRDFKTETFTAVVPVQIAELSLNDLPLVARFPITTDFHVRQHVGTREVELREYDGFLMQAETARDRDHVLTGEACDVAWFQRQVVPNAHLPGNPFRSLIRIHHGVIPTIEETPVAAVESSGREQAIVEAQRIASGLALVDGVLWKAVPEPVLVLDDSIERDVIAKGYVMEPWMLAQSKRKASSVYRLDEVPLIEAQYAPTLELGDFSIDMPEIEIFDATALRHPALVNALVESGGELVKWMGGRGLERKSLAYLTAFANLRDALSAFDESVAEGRDVDLDAYAVLLEAARTECVSDQGQSYGSASDAGAALKRLELSRTEFDIQSAFAP